MSGWVKVMNALPTNPKLLAVSAEASWLYVCGLCWCNEHLTDGVIPAHVLPMIAPTIKQPAKRAGELGRVNLWEILEDAYLIHDYLKVQASAATVEKKRADAAKRMAEARANKNGVCA